MPENIKITIKPESSSIDEDVEFTIHFNDPKMIGKKAKFIVETNVIVNMKDGSDETLEPIKKTFTISSTDHTFKIPAHKLPNTNYKGNKINIHSQVRVIYRKKEITQEIIRTDKIKDPIPDSQKNIIFHKDERNLLKSIRALPEKNRRTIRKILIVNFMIIASFVLTLLYFIYYFEHTAINGASDNYNFYITMFGVLTLVIFVFCAIGIIIFIKDELLSWLTISLNKKQMPINFYIDDYCRVSDLFKAKTSMDVDELTIQIAVCNMENGMYSRHVKTHDDKFKSVIDDFVSPFREFILFEKDIHNIKKGVEINSYLDDKIYFKPIYLNLLPKNTVSENYGIDFYWEVKFIHKDFIDQSISLPIDRFNDHDF